MNRETAIARLLATGTLRDGASTIIPVTVQGNHEMVHRLALLIKQNKERSGARYLAPSNCQMVLP
jgi:hypothetical protein